MYKHISPCLKMFLKNIMVKNEFYKNMYIMFLKNDVFIFNKAGVKSLCQNKSTWGECWSSLKNT